MSEKKKDIKREEEESPLDSDEDPSITSEAGYAAGMSSSNRSISSLELDSKQKFVEYVANGLEVGASDVIIIEELSEVIIGHEQKSNENEPKIIYEYPSDPDEEGSNQVPQVYFDNIDLCQEKSSFNVNKFLQNSATMTKEIENEVHEVPKEKESPDSPSNQIEIQDPCTQLYEIEIKEENAASQADPKIFGLKYVEYGSDEFADVEDNRDSLSDNSESYCGLQTVSNESFPNTRSIQGQKNETMEENPMLNKTSSYSSLRTEIINRPKEETSEVRKFHGVKNRHSEASCSYSLPNCSKLPDTFSIQIAPEESDKKNKCNLPTIVEESEIENKINILKDNQPPRAKANPLKIKAKVGVRKDKCNVCRVRLGLCAIRCRCGGYYCAKHRYDKEHNCPFDYKTMGAEEIRKNNPKVIAEKVRKL